MEPTFWRGRRVLLTGHTGFKGAWLSLWLQRLGAEVTGFALPPPTTPSLFELARVASGMASVTGDVRDLDAVVNVAARVRPEVVIHMAAQALVRESYARPVETYAINVMGTVHVLEAVRLAGSVRAVLVVTSDKCYENREWVWGYREDEPMGGHDPYSSSKGCAELVTAAYRRSFFAPEAHAQHGVAVASARAGNVIGGGDWAADRLVPDAIRAFAAGRKVRLRNPRATRPWQHVLEPLDGYLTLCERLYADGPRFAGGWNFGPRDEDARPVAAVIEALAGHWGRGAGWEPEGEPQPHEAHSLRLDCSRARAALGWRARLELDTALRWVAEWYDAQHRGEDARTLVLRDLARYEALRG
jgi:CDP-glucose 4,6-dehydratase